MSSIPSEMESGQTRASEIGPFVDRLERILDEGRDGGVEGCDLGVIDQALRELHAQMRIHHAIGVLETPKDAKEIAPRYLAQFEALRNEHSTMIGALDRLIRTSETLADLGLEDRFVFAARVRELIAVVRRHEAEEDRVLYLALWHDIGGES